MLPLLVDFLYFLGRLSVWMGSTQHESISEKFLDCGKELSCESGCNYGKRFLVGYYIVPRGGGLIQAVRARF
jgi:hypothetical protein